MKIAMIGHKRIPSREGGIEIVVGELSTRMAALGHDVTCYNRSGHHVSGSNFDKSKINEYNGVRIKTVPAVNKKGLAAVSSSFFAAIKAAFGRYDVVHFHAEGPCAMCLLPKLTGKRVIATIHGLDWQRSKWGGFASKYIKFGEKCAAKHADKIIVLSKNVQKYFKETYNRDTVLIPNGVSKPEILSDELIKEKYSLCKDGYFLYLGRLVPEKGIEYLIKAYKSLDCDKKLVIAGGSSDTSGFERQMHELAADDDRIIFTGFVEGRELCELYSNAYVYVLPSDLEGMPLSLLEAMSYGNCCLTSDIPECTEAVGEYALTFKKCDVADLADKIKMLYNNEDIVSDYKSKAQQYICDRFNWDVVTAKTLELYKK